MTYFSRFNKFYYFSSKFLRKMSTQHLAAGSALPPVSEDRLRLYSMRFCPYVERTKLVLEHRNIPHETVFVNLKSKPEWLFERNPLGLVPIIEYRGRIVYESAICDEFLEEMFPTPADAPPLMPRCPFDRAAARLLMQSFDKMTSKYFALMRQGDQTLTHKEKLEAFHVALEPFEDVLAKSGKPFFGGDNVGMADFHFWPFFERFDAMAAVAGDGLEILPAAKFPRLAAWKASMLDLDAVKRVLLPTELHRRFIVSYREGNPQYDMDDGIGDQLSSQSPKL